MSDRKSKGPMRRKPMKVPGKALWDEYGNLIVDVEEEKLTNEKPQKTAKRRNNAPQKTSQSESTEEEKAKKKVSKSKREKERYEYLELQQRVMEAKAQRNKAKKPRRAASVSNFSEFIKRQNDSAKKHVQEHKIEVPKLKYSNRKSQLMTRNIESSVSSRRPSRSQSVVNDRRYIKDFEEEFTKSSASLSIRRKRAEEIKDFEKRQQESTERKKEKIEQLKSEIEASEVKPKIVKRRASKKKLNELAKTKRETETQKIVEAEKTYQREVVTIVKTKKFSHPPPKYVTDITEILKSI